MVTQLLAQPGNSQCGDCGGGSPTHARADLGLLLCARCAQAHLQLGLVPSSDALALLDDAGVITHHVLVAGDEATAQKLWPLPGAAAPSKAHKTELWPLPADLFLVRALGNSAANAVLESTLQGSGLAKTYKPGGGCSDAERQAFIKSKVW